MKSVLKNLFLFTLFGLVTGYLFYSVQQEKFFSNQKLCEKTRAKESENKILLRDRMDLAWEHEFELTKDPATGTVPSERLLSALNYANQLRQHTTANGRVMGAIPGMNWTERGPNNVGGRTRAILIDPNDPTKKTIWAGSVGGGLWKTTDITADPPTWTVVNDLFSNIAISCIAYNPINTQEMFFGTGEGFYNADAQRGLGIWKSTDGGVNWNQLGSTNNSSFYYVQDLVVHPLTGDVFAATAAGLRKSNNGGTSWTLVLANGTGSLVNEIADLEIAADNSLWVGVGLYYSASTDGIYRSPYSAGSVGNAGTYSKLNTGANGMPTANYRRIEVACAPSNINTVYALTQSSASNGLYDLYKTTNGGTTWSTTPKPLWRDQNCGTTNTDFTRTQAWYDLIAAVDPNNDQIVYIGGVDLLKSTNGGTSFTQISSWWGGCAQEVHADQHTIVFEQGNSSIIYFGNDGGVWRTTNGSAAVPSIISKNYGYNVTQFYGAAMHPNAYSNYFLAGAQDNGSNQFNYAGVNSTIEVTGGDGCFMHIDQTQPQYQWTSYVYNNYFRSTNGGATWSSGIGFPGGSFVNPSDYDNISNIMYAASGGGSYLRWTNPQSGNTNAAITITNFNGSMVRHVSVSQNTSDKVFFGLNNGRVVRVDNANTVASGSTGTWINNGMGMPASAVSCIAVENGNDNHLLATYSSYGVVSVWETTNGGTNWTSVEGNLPDMPVRWALFNPNNNTQAVLATEVGIWSTDMLNGGATNWAPSNSGFANTRVDMLQIRSSDNIVIAATHGRGLYHSDVFVLVPYPDFSANKRLLYTGKPIQFSDASYKSTSWYWDFGDGTNSTSKNPVKSYSNPGVYTVTLQINGVAAYTSVKAAFIQILPNRGTPYTPAAGGNFELSTNDFGADNFNGTPWQRGNSGTGGKNGVFSGSNAWVTGLSGNYVDNSDVRLQTPNYNFTTAGAYTVRFYRKNSFEMGYDGFRVEYSLDKGDTWSLLGGVAAGWYDFANTTQNTSFPLNQPYFNANVTNYTLASWNASSLAGNPNVAFRIRFKSDVNTVAPGVAIDDFEIIGPNNSPLPVELILFTGKDEKDFNLLIWKTASEIINSGFDVERSATGYGFEKIGFVKGAGNSTVITDYKFEDHNLQHDIYYYRLKQIDFNGNFKYSNIIGIRRNSNHTGVEFVFPNPFDDEINLVVNGEFEDPVLIRIYDMNGKKVFENNLFIENYRATVRLSSLNLLQGTYFLSVMADDKTYNHKLFKK